MGKMGDGMTNEEHHEYICSIIKKLAAGKQITSAELYDLGCAAGINMKQLIDKMEERLEA